MNSPDAGNWRKPRRSFSNGNCVEVGAEWRKSSASEGSNCVEVAAPGRVLVRDTQDRAGAVLAFGAGAWEAFTVALKGGTR